jgi:hypothetical protein
MDHFMGRIASIPTTMAWVAAAGIALLALPVSAEEPPASMPAASLPAASMPATSMPAGPPLKKRIEQLEDENRELREDLQETKKAVQSLTETVAASDHAADLAAELNEPADGKHFRLWGFFDLSFAKRFGDETNPLMGRLRPYSSFIMNRINLFVGSQMTETLSALLEFRFTFMPHGSVESIELLGVGSYERVDTAVTDALYLSRSELGGLAIERVHFTWKPLDLFSVLAGRFLTPYGIWNVDHGSPVIIAVRQPFLILRRPVPLAQTGIKVFGRWFATHRLRLDYALTLSNGRGAIDAIWDLDDNKALGMRVAATAELSELDVTVGAYGYWGDYTDRKESVELTPDGLAYVAEPTEQFTERVLALDLLAQFYGIRLQSELVTGSVRYDVRPLPLNFLGETLPGNATSQLPGFNEGLQADFNRLYFYALMSYELPLSRLGSHRWLTETSARLYGMYEWSSDNDTTPAVNTAITWGLNIRPAWPLTLKIEGNCIRPINLGDNSLFGDFTTWGFYTQAAVVF